MKYLKHQGGFTLVEILATVAIISIGFVAILQVFATSNKLSSQARSLLDVTKFAEGRLNYYRSLGLSSLSNSTYDATGSLPSSLPGTATSCSAGTAKSACVLTVITRLITAVDANGWSSSIAMGRDGLPVISHEKSDGLNITKCGNAACSNGNTTTTVESSTHAVGSGTSLAISDDGYPVIAHFRSDLLDLVVTKCSNAACTSSSSATLESEGNVGQRPSIAVGADGLPILVFDFAPGNIKLIKCGNAACSSGNSTPASYGSAQNPTIAIGTDGLPVFAYTDGTKLTVVKCGNAACSSGNTSTQLTGAVTYGLYPSIAVPTDGFPVISHVSDTPDDLYFTKCGNAACSTGNTTTAINTSTTVDVDQDTSIVIGSDGLPVISYRDAANVDLLVTQCLNSTCTNNKTAIADSGTVGRFSSISVDGTPVISYLDTSNGGLLVAKCAVNSCGDDKTALINVLVRYFDGPRTIIMQKSTQVSEYGLGS